MIRFGYIITLIILVLGNVVSGQSFGRLMQAHFPASDPGAVVLVAQNSKVIFKEAYGMANLELDVRLKPDSRFRIGSLTKQFTACAILKLAEEGKLSLTDRLTKYLKDFPAAYDSITILNLLTHTSGISLSKGYWNEELRKKDFTPKALVEVFKNEPPDFEPGTRFVYNNNNYVLLGYLVEQLSGLSFADYLATTFFKPLGMHHTSLETPAEIIPGKVAGYRYGNNTRFENAPYLSMTQPYAAGAIVSTVDDLFTWMDALMHNKVIRAASLANATTSFHLNNGTPTNYGFGWAIGNIRGEEDIKHDGLINGFSSFMTWLPEQGICTVVLTNCEYYNPEDIGTRLTAISLHKPYPEVPLKTTPETLKKYQAVYDSKTNGKRIVQLLDSSLYVYYKGGTKQELFSYAKDQFFPKNSLETFSFIRDTAGNITTLKVEGTGQTIEYSKNTDTLHPLKISHLTNAELDRYQGWYQFSPDFALHIFREGTQLYGKGEGPRQIKQPILPVEKNKFVAKYLDAELWFTEDESGKIVGVTKVQNGESKAVKR